MPAALDLRGTKYGRLTAISLDISTGKRLWLFKCDCGNMKLKPASYVRNGTTSSCGCLRKEVTAKNRFKDLTGKKIGRLTVLRALPERTIHKQIQWECLCECGNTTTTTSLSKKNPTKSCGCIKSELASARCSAMKQENPVSRTKEYRKQQKTKRRENPNVVVAERVSRMIALSLQAIGQVKAGRTFEMLGYTPQQLRKHIEMQFLDGMTWDNRSEWEIDHITPISTATTKEDVIALNQLPNLRPLWARLNNQKNSRKHFLI